jgi:hypothetical protein
MMSNENQQQREIRTETTTFKQVHKNNKHTGFIVGGGNCDNNKTDTADLEKTPGYSIINKERLYRDRRGLMFNVLKYVYINQTMSFTSIRNYTYSSGYGLEKSIMHLLECGALESYDLLINRAKYNTKGSKKNSLSSHYSRINYRVTDKGKKLLKLMLKESKMLPSNFMRYNLSEQHEEDDNLLDTMLKQV